MVEQEKKSPSSGQPGGETMGRKGTNLPTDSSIQQTSKKYDAKKFSGFELVTPEKKPLGKGNFTNGIPNALLRDWELGGLAFHILCHLLTDNPKSFTPNHKFFEGQSNCGKTAVNDAISELQWKGYLYIGPQTKGTIGCKWHVFLDPLDNHFPRKKDRRKDHND